MRVSIACISSFRSCGSEYHTNQLPMHVLHLGFVELLVYKRVSHYKFHARTLMLLKQCISLGMHTLTLF